MSFFIKEDVELPELSSIETIEENDIVGVDLGIKELGITSDGETFKNERAYKNNLKKLKSINVEFLERLKVLIIERSP